MPARTITLQLDEADWDTLQGEIASRQRRSRWPEGGTIVPNGESCLVGSLLAEAIRDLDEYRSMYNGTDPNTGE